MYLGSVTESCQLSKSLNEYDAYDSKLEFATVRHVYVTRVSYSTLYIVAQEIEWLPTVTK